MVGIVQERWMFTITRYPNGKCFATAPFMVGQNNKADTPKKLPPKKMEVGQQQSETKSLFEVN